MDYDLDSACFPLSTCEVLVYFTGFLMVHLVNSPQMFCHLSYLILIGDMGWKFFANLSSRQKTRVCQLISLSGQAVFPSEHKNCFICGKCSITLAMLIEALEEAGVEQVVVYAYGMKARDVSRYLGQYKMPRNPVAPCRWDIGRSAVIEGDKIPLFVLDESVVCEKVYPMLQKKAGSVELAVPVETVIVYQHLLHILKAL